MQTKLLFYTKDPNGGIGRLLEIIQQELIKRKISQFVLSHNYVRSKRLIVKTIGSAIPKQDKLSLKSIYRSLNNLFLLYLAIKINSPGCIVSLDMYANISLNILKPFLRNIKLINSTHVNLFEHLRSNRSKVITGLLFIIVKFFYRLGDLHLVPANGLRRQLILNFGLSESKVKFIPNCLNVSHVQLISKEAITDKYIYKKLKNESSFKLMSIGRLDKQKDFATLIEVFADKSLVEKYNLKLFIMGDGSQKKSLEIKVKQLDLTNSIFFLDWKDNPYKYLAHADGFILISNYEGFSYVLVEALALGVPVIASDVEFGPREILQNGKYGILLKSNKAKDITYAITSLINSLQKRTMLSRMGPLRARAYDTKLLINRYLKIFHVDNG